MKFSLFIVTSILLVVGVTSSVPKSPAPEESSMSPVVVHDVASTLEPEEELLSIVLPETVLQGDPMLVEFEGVGSVEEVVSLYAIGSQVWPFLRDGKVEALVPVDLRQEPGTYKVEVSLVSGRTLSESFAVVERKAPTAPLGIPEKLGGDTKESTSELVSTLVEEGKIINAIKVSSKQLWESPFRYPVESVFITDVYGYGRETNGTVIAHKGTDFRAKVGTPIYAINDGQVSYTGYLRNYGNTVAIDHGSGILSIYMHLSSIAVTRGQRVAQGEKLGLSGDTGYTLGAHLHLTVKINGISINPEKFFSLVK